MAERTVSSIAAVLVGAFLLLAGCAPPPLYAPRYHGPTPDYYQVRRGDTLYSIGQRFGVDHKRIMLWNDIRDPGNLQLGQRLRLTAPPGQGGGPERDVATKDEPRVGKVAVGGGSTSAGRGGGSASGKQAGGGGSEPEGGAPSTWRWPLDGRIIQRFGGDGREHNNGIDIAASAGTEVRAVAPGTVVYSGDGLRGYGNLVIIRHGGGYITTYAYNQVNLVAEDDSVEAGDVVARVGETGAATETSLHFEVRRRTEPIDPLKVLPER